MAIDENALQHAQTTFLTNNQGWQDGIRAAIEAYEAARKQEPERPMLNRIAEYIGAVRHQDVPSLRIAHGVLDLIANPSATVENAMKDECDDGRRHIALRAWRAAIQRIREGG